MAQLVIFNFRMLIFYMAKVVLVWNEHPTEVVAGFHARKVAQILREKYGHEVVMEKIPVAETNYGIVSRTKNPRTVQKRLSNLKSSIEIAQEIEAKHNLPAFNFHCSEASGMGKAIERNPKDFELEELLFLPFSKLPAELVLFRKPWQNHFVLEMPAYEETTPERIYEKKSKK